MPNRKYQPRVANECFRCATPLPRVVYGYPNWQALEELDRQGESYVLGGCIPNLRVARTCPRCGLVIDR
jgi:hypothetical protein